VTSGDKKDKRVEIWLGEEREEKKNPQLQGEGARGRNKKEHFDFPGTGREYP
jgi:hypothetical protein